MSASDAKPVAVPGAGTPASAAREAILGRVRDALGPQRPVLEPMPPSAPDDTRDLVTRFAERVEDYRATVTVVPSPDTAPTDLPDAILGADSVVAAIEAACQRTGAERVGVPDGFDLAWVPGDVEAVPVRSGTREELLPLGALDAVLCTAPLGIAETGTFVLDAGAGQGPRAASLLPDVLIVVIDASALVGGVVAAVERMRRVVVETGRPLTMISGPSATSDIELDRVEGVHGPRVLEVIVVGGLRQDLATDHGEQLELFVALRSRGRGVDEQPVGLVGIHQRLAVQVELANRRMHEAFELARPKPDLLELPYLAELLRLLQESVGVIRSLRARAPEGGDLTQPRRVEAREEPMVLRGVALPGGRVSEPSIPEAACRTGVAGRVARQGHTERRLAQRLTEFRDHLGRRVDQAIQDAKQARTDVLTRGAARRRLMTAEAEDVIAFVEREVQALCDRREYLR